MSLLWLDLVLKAPLTTINQLTFRKYATPDQWPAYAILGKKRVQAFIQEQLELARSKRRVSSFQVR
jgi:hypothetical protein